MGVVFTLRLYAPDQARANAAARAAFDRVRELNNALSDYDPDSELMQLCRRSGPSRPVSVSDDLFTVLAAAQKVSRQSDGAFDVTVGPIVKLWRTARRTGQLPPADELEAARKLVGYTLLDLDAEKQTVELGREGMRLDLGGIAKGYAGDEMLRVLRKHGITRALIAVSGDVVVGDSPPDRDGWRIAVAPLSVDDPPTTFLCLKNAAVSTSGDAFQHVEIDGRRYSHIVDPRTGLGLTTRSSATVVAPAGYLADALASAVSVLGAEKGLKLLAGVKGTAGLLITADGEQVRRVASPQFDDHKCSKP